MLEVEGAVVRFGEQIVLDHVDLTVGADETVALLGPSGSGKTTLLRAVAGLQRLDAGRVRCDGVDLAGVPPHERRFGLMFQEYALFPHRDVRGNVEFGLRMARVAPDARAQRVDEVLRVVGLADLSARRVATLSGGEQQRVALARSLAVSPRLLMLDEPLGALDRALRTRLLDEIRALLDREGLPALYVTHDQHEAFSIASRVAVMRAGRIVQIGAPTEVWDHPADPWVAAFLGFGPVVAAEAANGAVVLPWGGAAPVTFSGPATVVPRPDAVTVHADGPLRAVVVAVRFGGASVELELEPEAGPRVTCTVATADAPGIGTTVRCAIDGERVLVYAGRAD